MKLALIGYGKMGRMIEEIAVARGHEVVCVIDVDNQQDFGSEAFRSAEVAIEFTAPAAAYGNVVRAFGQGVKVVCGTTGWREEHEADVRRLIGEGHTLFWASNFSLGVAVFGAVNRYLARIMARFPEYDVRMEETHHVHKLDAPSGTAITLAEDIISGLGRKTRWELGGVTDAEGRPFGEQPSPCGTAADGGTLRIDAVRRGEVPGIHTVTYDSGADCIQITHSAHSRRGFALGAVLAAEFTATHTGLLGIADMFDF
ncbi:MAG: 4-hydroxy-tetrahydrodipicolinate reductase [Alloprevotella sp.]|nr:4-hydroxy-tetrahydrodipicolinate reductase [Alloprevotella sp.]